MAALTVGTDDAVEFEIRGAHSPIVQNLGPGVLYVGNSPQVTAATGLQIPVGGGFEFQREFDAAEERSLWLIASQAGTDVRTLVAP